MKRAGETKTHIINHRGPNMQLAGLARATLASCQRLKLVVEIDAVHGIDGGAVVLFNVDIVVGHHHLH